MMVKVYSLNLDVSSPLVSFRLYSTGFLPLFLGVLRQWSSSPILVIPTTTTTTTTRENQDTVPGGVSMSTLHRHYRLDFRTSFLDRKTVLLDSFPLVFEVSHCPTPGVIKRKKKDSDTTGSQLGQYVFTRSLFRSSIMRRSSRYKDKSSIRFPQGPSMTHALCKMSLLSISSPKGLRHVLYYVQGLRKDFLCTYLIWVSY